MTGESVEIVAMSAPAATLKMLLMAETRRVSKRWLLKFKFVTFQNARTRWRYSGMGLAYYNKPFHPAV
jgi:hypothetical protein